MLIADLFTPAVAIGVGGALVALGRSTGWGLQVGVAAAFGVATVLICSALAASLRLPQT